MTRRNDNTNLDSRVPSLAPRAERLAAAIIDGLVLIAVAMPVMMVVNLTDVGGNLVLTQVLGLAAGFGIFLGINYKLLRDSGQTIGKRVMNIRIVGGDDRLVDVNELLLRRYAPIRVVSLVPVIGPLMCLGDALSIFRNNQACFHDDLVRTRVVAA